MKQDADSSSVLRQPAAPLPQAPNAQQLTGRHARLERELAQAFSAQPWPGALIERLANELAETERLIGVAHAAGHTD